MNIKYIERHNSLKLFNYERRNQCLKKSIILTNLAWTLLSKICATIISKIWDSLHSQEFISRHRTSPTAFLRKRKFPFHNLVLFLLGNLKSSYNKEEANLVFKHLKSYTDEIRSIGYEYPESIGIISPYKAQIELLTKILDSCWLSNDKHVSCFTLYD